MLLSIFHCSFVICAYDQCLSPLSIFESGYFVFLMLSFRHYLYILHINPLSNVRFVNIFSLSVSCLVIQLILLIHKILKIPYGIRFACCFLLSVLLVSYPRNDCKRLMSGSFFPYFPPEVLFFQA